MADVTISSLTKGIPSGNNILPYSTGSSTLGTSVSALFENTNYVGIGKAPEPFKGGLQIGGPSQDLIVGNNCRLGGNINAGFLGVNIYYDQNTQTFKSLQNNMYSGDLSFYSNSNEWVLRSSTQITAAGNNVSTLTDRLKINISGAVTLPSQPAFSARGYSSSAGVIGVYSGNILGIRWNTVEINTGNNFNNTTGLFTAPVDGRYVYNLSLNRKANGADWQGAYVTLNNSTILRNAWDPPVNNQQYGPMSISGIVSLNAGNTVGFGYHSNYSAPQTVADSLTENSAYIYLLG